MQGNYSTGSRVAYPGERVRRDTTLRSDNLAILAVNAGVTRLDYLVERRVIGELTTPNTISRDVAPYGNEGTAGRSRASPPPDVNACRSAVVNLNVIEESLATRGHDPSPRGGPEGAVVGKHARVVGRE